MLELPRNNVAFTVRNEYVNLTIIMDEKKLINKYSKYINLKKHYLSVIMFSS